MYLFLLLLSLVFVALALMVRQLRQARRPVRFLNPGSQAALRRMLSDWARVQRSTMV